MKWIFALMWGMSKVFCDVGQASFAGDMMVSCQAHSV